MEISDNDKSTEAMIKAKGLTAPRITPAWVAGIIAGETYTVLPSGRTMICELSLQNGFTVRGESSVVSIENFDEEIGRKVSRENAVDKVWGFEAYLLKQRLFDKSNDDITFVQLVDNIAQVCHETNRAYCAALGDDSQAPWAEAPQWQKDSARLGVELHTANRDASPAASHESWMAQKVAEGWVYGPTKDAANKTHPCIVPFVQLSVEQQAKDFIFRGVVHAMNDIYNPA